MPRLCLTLARLCSTMWVGAALLFVATSVAEQVHPAFDDATKDTLALVRFPWYYGSGATLIAVAFLATRFAGLAGRTRISAMLLLVAAWAVLWGDFWFVYRPLRDALTPPGSDHGPGFAQLHLWSECLNAIGFLLSAAAAVILCAARRDERGAGAGSK